MPKAAKKKTTKSKRTKKSTQPKPRGLAAGKLTSTAPPLGVSRLSDAIEQDGGSVLAQYKDPLGGNWQVLAGLPIDKVVPTPFQRDLSESHVKRMTKAIGTLDRYLDPVVAVRTDEGEYWVPNGFHRTAAMHQLGARSIVAIIVPERAVAHRILALNTEKAHNLKERALEVIRLAQSLADLDPRAEKEFELEFEEPALLTLGLCYQQKSRFSGSSYNPVLKRVEKFLAAKLPKALETRAGRAEKLLALDDAVNAAVKALKEKGFESPYLKAFVVARINPLRFQRGAKAEFDDTIDKMLKSALKFDVGRVKTDQLARAGGAPDE